MARPSSFTPEMVELICKRVATHPYGMPTLCKMFDDMPSKDTINVWRWEYPEFSAKYVEAKRMQAELLAESFEDVHIELMQDSYKDDKGVKRIDAGLVAASKLLIDTRKWTAARLAPKIYGDRSMVETTTTVPETAERLEKAKDKQKDY